MTRPALATVHGTGWQKDGSGDWTTVPGYCWCGVLARSCPEPKEHVSEADTWRLDERAAAGHMPGGVDFFGLSL